MLVLAPDQKVSFSVGSRGRPLHVNDSRELAIMAKALLVCFRRKPEFPLERFAAATTERIRPDNVEVPNPYIYQNGCLFTYVFNPAPTVRCQNASLCLGVIQNFSPETFRPRSAQPEGTFALFRANDDYVELVSDYTASRTIWYIKTEQFFVASTSQRMIVAFLGDFQLNEKAVAWMLSNGTLGPEQSWDKRVKPVPGNSRVLLDRARWSLIEEFSRDYDFEPARRPQSWHISNFKEALHDAISELDINPSEWTLALSGGLDSRSLLYYLKNKTGLHCVTWGLKDSLGKRHSDATIAKSLAQHCGFEHRYAEVDMEVEKVSTTLNRYLVADEGRLDHLSGYMDGLELWANLSRSGQGCIRGYDAQGGTRAVSNEFQARWAAALRLTNDYAQSIIPIEFEVGEKDLPETLQRKTGESLARWRDRMWLSFRTPVVTAGLDDIKLAYVEVINPLLFKGVVQAIQALPDDMRTNKFLFRKIVSEMFPSIPFARRESGYNLADILDLVGVKEFLQRNLLRTRGEGILPAAFISHLIGDFERNTQKQYTLRRLKVFARAHVPEFLRSYLQKELGRAPMNRRRVALRALIIERMNQILTEDAGILRRAMK
jgi:hypothetical protein